ALRSGPLYQLLQLRIDLLNVSGTVDSLQTPRLSVIFDQRLGQLIISFQPGRNALFVVIRAMYEFCIRMQIAAALRLRRLRINIIDLSANRARTTPRKATHQLFSRDVDLDRLDHFCLFGSDGLELLRLNRGS